MCLKHINYGSIIKTNMFSDSMLYFIILSLPTTVIIPTPVFKKQINMFFSDNGGILIKRNTILLEIFLVFSNSSEFHPWYHIMYPDHYSLFFVCLILQLCLFWWLWVLKITSQVFLKIPLYNQNSLKDVYSHVYLHQNIRDIK